ncbi:MAG: hypothetical protein KBT63_06545 [Porticoccaceae bacterium]|nr:hypothetical protein [Porticoccaceae bacterium]
MTKILSEQKPIQNAMKKTLMAAATATALIALYGGQVQAATPEEVSADSSTEETLKRRDPEEMRKRMEERREQMEERRGDMSEEERLERREKRREGMEERRGKMSEEERLERKGKRRERMEERRGGMNEEERLERKEKRRERMEERRSEMEATGLGKQRENKINQERKELGKGSEQGQEMREQNSKKWWKFWGEPETPAEGSN